MSRREGGIVTAYTTVSLPWTIRTSELGSTLNGKNRFLASMKKKSIIKNVRVATP